MSSVSAACFLVCFGILLSALKRGADLLSPARVFASVWALVLGLADLKLSVFQEEWSAYSWIVLLSALAAVLTGILVVDILHIGRVRHVPLSSIRRGVSGFTAVVQRKYVSLLAVLTGIYLTSLMIEAVAYGNLPMFSPRPDHARMEFGLFGIHLLVTLAPSIMILATQYYLVSREKLRYKVLVFAIFAITFVSYGFLLQRFSFVMWAIVSGCLAYYHSRHINWKSLLAGAAGFTAFIMYLQSIRLSRYVENYIYVVSKMRISKTFALVTEPYMYTVMNLENLARGVDRLETFTFGLFTFDPVAALAGIKHMTAAYFGIVERPFLNSGYNTFPFLWTFYRDFGYGGMVFLCLALGVAIGHLYHGYRTEPTMRRATAYALAVFFMVLSFFTNVLAMLNMITNIVLLYFVNRYLDRVGVKIGTPSGDGGFPEDVLARP